MLTRKLKRESHAHSVWSFHGKYANSDFFPIYRRIISIIFFRFALRDVQSRLQCLSHSLWLFQVKETHQFRSCLCTATFQWFRAFKSPKRRPTLRAQWRTRTRLITILQDFRFYRVKKILLPSFSKEFKPFSTPEWLSNYPRIWRRQSLTERSKCFHWYLKF